MSNWFSSDIVATVLFVVVIFQFNRIATLINFLKMSFRPTKWSAVTTEAIPDYIDELLHCTQQSMLDLGFVKLETQVAAPIFTIDPRSHVFSDLYWHEQQSVLARVDKADVISGMVTKVYFVSVFANGRNLLTVNREQWAQLPVPSDVVVVDIYADNLTSQWQAHLQRLSEEASTQTIMTNQQEVLEKAKAFEFSSWLLSMQEHGWVYEVKPAFYRFTARGAWCYSRQLVKISVDVRKALAVPYQQQHLLKPHSARLAEMDTIGTMIALAAEPMPAWLKTGLFILTLVLSALLFGYSLGFMSAAAILVVLVVHELGHLSAMRLFNYQNLSILFLPFLGAAATGHKANASPWQEAIVLLAGPVVGLVVAFAISQISADKLPVMMVEFTRSFIVFSVILNLFNLIPAGMLDGGRIIELAILGRFPYARAIFSSIGISVGLAYAIWSQSLVIGVVMMLLLLSIPLKFNVAKTIKNIRSQATTANKLFSPEQALNALGRNFANEEQGSEGATQWAQRVNISRAAYPALLQGVPSFLASIGIFISYLVVVVLTLVIVIWSFVKHPAPIMSKTASEQQLIDKQYQIQAKVTQQKVIARYNAEPNILEKWNILQELEYDELAGVDTEWLAQQRKILLAQLPVDDVGKLRYLFGTKPSDVSNLHQIIQQLTHNGVRQPIDLEEEQLLLFLDVQMQIAQELTVDEVTLQLPTLEKLWLDLETAKQKHHESRPQLASIIAHMHVKKNDINAATLWMNRYQAIGGESAKYAYGWFLLDINQAEQALTIAKNALSTPPQNQHVVGRMQHINWQTLAGWAEMELGNAQRADIYFQARLAEQQQRLESNQADQSWWLRLLAMTQPKITHSWLNESVLDHLVALNSYDPKAARILLATYKHQSSYLDSTVEGWGQIRKKAHKAMLQQVSIGNVESKMP